MKNLFIRRRGILCGRTEVTKLRVVFRSFFRTRLKTVSDFLSRYPKQQGLFVGFGLLFLVALRNFAKSHYYLRHVMSDCPSVRMGQLDSHWSDIHEIWYLSIFEKYVMKIQASLMSDQNNRYFTWIVTSVQQLCSRLDSPKDASPSVRLTAFAFQLLNPLLLKSSSTVSIQWNYSHSIRLVSLEVPWQQLFLKVERVSLTPKHRLVVDQVSVFMSSRDRVVQFYPRTLCIHCSRLLRHAWTTLGARPFPGHHRRNFPWIPKYIYNTI